MRQGSRCIARGLRQHRGQALRGAAGHRGHRGTAEQAEQPGRCGIDDDALGVELARELVGYPVAAEAADRAVALFREMSGTPAALLQRAHEPMRQTRGAAVSIASLDAAAGSITFAGAGNVSGRIVSGVEDRSLLSQHGTLGVQVRRPQDLAYAWPPHAVVVLHSDGLTSRWNLRDSGALLQADPAVIAAWLLRDHTRGHDDVTVVVVRRSAA